MDFASQMEEIGQKAKKAAAVLSTASEKQKNTALLAAAALMTAQKAALLEANKQDIDNLSQEVDKHTRLRIESW